MDFQTILSLVAALGIGSFLGTILAPMIGFHYEERKLKQERRNANLEKRIDTLWRLLFYFGNMESWGVVQGAPYAFATEVLGRYLDEMAEMMKSEMYMGSVVRQLWFDWQPYAVASVEQRRGSVVYQFYSKDEFVKRSHRLHQALKHEYEMLLREYELEANHTSKRDSKKNPFNLTEPSRVRTSG